MSQKTIQINIADNVAIALEDLEKGYVIELQDRKITDLPSYKVTTFLMDLSEERLNYSKDWTDADADADAVFQPSE